MRRKRRGWLFAALGIAGAIVAGIIAAMIVSASSEARGASAACRAPDPANRPIVSLASGELRALAALAWAEARGERDPYCSMLAVSAVVVNRIRTNPRYFGASVTQVINRPHQFSPFGKRDPNRNKMGKVDESDRLFVTGLLAAIAAASGIDNTGGATHFYSGARPAWAHGMVLTMRLGGHTFMKVRD
jgi:spore germination cell wall hydrolase CwlJ-like protein